MGLISKSKAHIAAVEESYFKHLLFALKYAFCCFKAGFMAIIHGFVPAFFETGASDLVKKMARCVNPDYREL